MKKILLVGHDGEARLPFEKSKAWTAFANVLSEYEFEIVSEYSDDVHAIIANSHKHDFMNNNQFEKISHTKRTLILWEPYVVETERYKKETLESYGHIYAPSRIWADRVGGISFNWPQDPIQGDSSKFENWESRLDKIVMIQGNKFSARRGELYSLRRRLLCKLEQSELDLYGTNWNTGVKFDWWHWSRSLINSKITDISLRSSFGIGRKYPNFRGSVEDKQKTLEKYQISLVIENSADFVSEKLFDSLRAGCLTIYVGPNLELFGLSSDVAIVARNSRKEILATIEKVVEMGATERRLIANQHYENLKACSGFWENELVLANLAHQIARELA